MDTDTDTVEPDPLRRVVDRPQHVARVYRRATGPTGFDTAVTAAVIRLADMTFENRADYSHFFRINDAYQGVTLETLRAGSLWSDAVIELDGQRCFALTASTDQAWAIVVDSPSLSVAIAGPQSARVPTLALRDVRQHLDEFAAHH